MPDTTTARLFVKVVPGSSRDCIAGWLGDTLKVRVTAPPERGKANAAVKQTIAAALDISANSVRIVKGTASPRKLVEVDGMTVDEIRRRLAMS